jgi:hypothetical protein
MDAIRCGCIPLVPNTLCFPEIVPLYWRYSHAGNLILKLQHIFNDKTFILPEMICQDEVDNFFKNIIKIMKR